MSCTSTVVALDLCVYAGDSYSFSILWQDSEENPIDLTGYTARMQARASAQAPDPPSFEKTHLDGIVLGGAAGTIEVMLDPFDTDQVILKQLYDLEVTSPTGYVTTLVAGAYLVTKDITK